MFTGIVQNLGKIIKIQEIPEGKRVWISSDMNQKNFTLGNSIAVNGACMTVEASEGEVFQITAVHESLKLSTLGEVEVDDIVNLEAPLTLQTPIAGHLVSGHVDGIANVIDSSANYWIEAPEALMKYIAKKGSVTINGVSLTVAEIDGQKIRIALIPETLERTNLGSAEKVNLEIDLIARYLERLNQN
jgi:riboflavin synthase